MSNEKADCKSLVKFGKWARENLYDLDPKTVFLNHGSYGVSPKLLLRKRLDMIKRQDNSPDKWFIHDSFDMYKQNVSSLADYLRLDDPRHLMFCINSSDAMNCVVKSVEFHQDNIEEEVIMSNEYTYMSVKKVLDFASKYRYTAADKEKIKVFRVPCSYPIESVEQVIAEYDKMCEHLVKEKRYRIRLAVLDHISSMTATRFPVKRIIETIRKWSRYTLIAVDGAHAIGQLEINLKELDCDFYCSNLHKWFLTPRSCAFLYVRDLEWAEQHLQPNVVCNNYGKSLMENFFYRGTSDNSSHYLADDCIRYHTNYLGGLAKISEYNETLVEQASEMLAKEWKTSLLQMPKEMQAPFMRVIRLPAIKGFELDENADKDEAMALCSRLVKLIYDKYRVHSFINPIQNHLYCRISCYIYNEPSDYVILRNAILELAENAK